MSEPGKSKSLAEVRAIARSMLDAVLAGDHRPLAIAHPLEFVCIPILRTPVFGVCGHIWESNRSAPTIHCHSWHLASEVLAGAVLNEVFAVTDRADSDHHLLGIDSLGPLDRITPTGRTVIVRDEERTLYQRGSSYCLPAGAFHRSTPVSDGPTLTLLAATVRPGGRDQIVAATRVGRHATVRREELPSPEARSLAALLRSALDTLPL